jgi:hypothetical protein
MQVLTKASFNGSRAYARRQAQLHADVIVKKNGKVIANSKKGRTAAAFIQSVGDPLAQQALGVCLDGLNVHVYREGN